MDAYTKDNIRADDCQDLMFAFILRLLRDSVGDAEPEEVEAARRFIIQGKVETDELESPFTFQQLCTYLNIRYEIIFPVFYDLQLIGWRKNSIIYRSLLNSLTHK